MINKQFPEGAISIELIEKIYLEDMLRENNSADLIPVFNTFAKGKRLEQQGLYKEAKKIYNLSLKIHPKNQWLKKAKENLLKALN